MLEETLLTKIAEQGILSAILAISFFVIFAQAKYIIKINKERVDEYKERLKSDESMFSEIKRTLEELIRGKK